MAINFPASPAVNQQYTASDRTWVFDGTAWNLKTTPAWVSPTVQTVTYSASPTISWTGVDVSRITLTGNAVITNAGAVDGQKMVLEVTQGGAGSYTVSFTGETVFGTDITSITLTTTVGKTDRIGLIYRAAESKYDIVAFAKGY